MPWEVIIDAENGSVAGDQEDEVYEVYDRRERGYLTQAEAGELPGMSERYLQRYRTEGESGLPDKHFYSFYRCDRGGGRSYGRVKHHLQARGRVRKASGRGRRRRKRERAPMEGMLPHQDGSTHEWIPGAGCGI